MKQRIALTLATTVALAAAPGTADAATTARTPAAPTTTARASHTPAPAARTITLPAPAGRITPTVPAGTITPTVPARTVTLTVADNGRRIRVRRGENVLVRLRVDPRQNPDPTTWWRAIDESGHALRARPQTAISIRGLTRGRYQAVARGQAALSSSRSVCPQNGTGPTCHSVQGWNVTVDVR